jgi:hypothetical protein
MRVYLNSVKKAHLKSVISYSILPADATIFETERVHVAPGKERSNWDLQEIPPW